MPPITPRQNRGVIFVAYSHLFDGFQHDIISFPLPGTDHIEKE